MAKFIKGDIVVVPFPFSDLTQAKRRPAMVIAELEGDDVILSQITSQWFKDKYAIPIDENDFATGTLKQRSNIRPNRIFQQIDTLSYTGLGISNLKKSEWSSRR